MSYLNGCIWIAASGGTGDFVYDSVVSSFFSPMDAGAIDTITYNYTAELGSAREAGFGTWNAGTSTLTRTPVISTNANATVNFAQPPTVQMGGPLADDGWVLAASNITDHAVVRGDGGGINIQDSGVFIDDSNAITGVSSIDIGNADTTVTRAEAGVIAVASVPLYSNIPINSQSTAYTLVLADAQRQILHPSSDNNARTFTIPANSSVAYPLGTAITFVNRINTVTIAITSDTLVLAGFGTTGSRTLAANGVATALKIESTTWIISGTGLT